MGDKVKEKTSGCFAVGGILLYGWGPHVPLDGRVIDGKVQSAWSLFSHDETFLSWLDSSLPAWQYPHPEGMGSHWIYENDLHSHQISTQPNTSGRFWTNINHQNTNWEIIDK